MSLGTSLIVLLAAVLHASWNALLRAGTDRLWSMTVMCIAIALVCAGLAPLVSMPAKASWDVRSSPRCFMSAATCSWCAHIAAGISDNYIREHDSYSLPQFIGESPFQTNNNKAILHRIELRIEQHMAHLLPTFPPVQKKLLIADIYLFWLKPLRVVVGEVP